MMLSGKGEDAYFAASNSRAGFCSYYKECFDSARVKHVYAVKGGPGTGKSRFMREVAEAGQRAGWTGEYIYCSSDSTSLDGIILTHGTDCFAVIDATAPHTYEPTRPGIREDIINLGSFWNAEKLSEGAEELERLNAEKSAAYRQAYRYLSSMGEMIAVRDALVSRYVRRGAINACAARLLQQMPEGRGYEVRPALIRSVGMNGSVGFDTYFARAGRRVLVEDCRGISQYLMQALGERAVSRRQAIRLSHDPVCPDRIDGMFFVESGLAVVVGTSEEFPEYDKRIVMRRYLETGRMHGIRQQVNYAERMGEAMLMGAIESMERVKAVHFEVEERYIAAMDFEAKEFFTKCFCEQLFGLQNGEKCDTI